MGVRLIESRPFNSYHNATDNEKIDGHTSLAREVGIIRVRARLGSVSLPQEPLLRLVVEAAELLEQFQWLTPEQSTSDVLSSKTRDAVQQEVADVAIYL